MKINPVIRPRNKARHNRYCGPCALSILTGQDTGECARVIRMLSSVKAVRGTYPRQLIDSLSWFGFKVARANYPSLETGWIEGDLAWRGTDNLLYDAKRNLKQAPTLARWLKQTKDIRTSGRVFLLCAGWHWIVISGRRYACGLTEKIVSVKDAPHRRARVAGVWEITK